MRIYNYTNPIKIEAIASKVGYGDAFTFAKAFKRHTGKSPTEYRNTDGIAAET
ncbi:MAG: AraC family transcriptional regulator [Candidatus Faecousia sp.]|nr:AraC family transcriptional regulator [Candidatus Faecousia sp.]